MMLIRPPWNVLKGIVEVGKGMRALVICDGPLSVTVWNHRDQYSPSITSRYYISMLKSITYHLPSQLYSYAICVEDKWMDGNIKLKQEWNIIRCSCQYCLRQFHDSCQFFLGHNVQCGTNRIFHNQHINSCVAKVVTA